MSRFENLDVFIPETDHFDTEQLLPKLLPICFEMQVNGNTLQVAERPVK
jgi:hypothetical protein